MGHEHKGHEHKGHEHKGHAHTHEHSHDAHHGHHHHHGDPVRQGRAFAWAIGLNSLFVLLEFGYGYLAHSTALMADAGHNLSDVLSLVLAWGAALLTRRAPAGRYTFGLRKTSILVALLNAMLLIFACGVIVWEAVHRLWQPVAVAGGTVAVLAGIGILVNGFSAWLFMAGAKHDLNLKGAYLHLAADAAISFGVLVTGLLLMVRDWYWLDPLVSLLIVAIVLWGTWHLLTEALQLVLAAVPANVDLDAVQAFLQQQDGVSEVRDLHIWALSTTETALTALLVMPAGHPGDQVLQALHQQLRERHAIMHATLEIALGQHSHDCSLLQSGADGHTHEDGHRHTQQDGHRHTHEDGHTHSHTCAHAHGHAHTHGQPSAPAARPD